MDNSREVLDKLNNVNNPSSMHTYDFSTLYTNLPLDLVRNESFQMIYRYFDINERKSNKYIVLNHFGKLLSLLVLIGKVHMIEIS